MRLLYLKNAIINLNKITNNLILSIVWNCEGGIPDIVENDVTGFLVQQSDVEALTEKLEILINNPTLCKQMGSAGRKKYEKEFTIEIFE